MRTIGIRKSATKVALSLLASSCLLPSESMATVTSFQPYRSEGHNLIHITTANFDVGNENKNYIVGLTTEGEVISYKLLNNITDPNQAQDSTRWTKSLGHFGFMIEAADIDDDGQDEILIPCADGHLRIIETNGDLTDLDVSEGALYCVVVGQNSDGDNIIMTGGVDGTLYQYSGSGTLIQTNVPSPQGVIRRLVAGNFSGYTSGTEDVMVFYKESGFRGGNHIDVVRLSDLNSPWYWPRAIEDDASDSTTLEWTDKQLPWAYDMDGDGKDEVVAHWGAVRPRELKDDTTITNLSGLLNWGETLKLGRDYQDNEGTLPHRTKYVSQQGLPGNFTSNASNELFSIRGNYMYLFNHNNATSLDFDSIGFTPAEYEFTDMARIEDSGTYDRVVLTGPVNGDDHFYVVDLSQTNWQAEAKTVDTYGGKLKWISNNLDTLNTAVSNFPGGYAKAIGDPIHVAVISAGAPGWWDMTQPNINAKVIECKNYIQQWRDEVSGVSGGNPDGVIFHAVFSADTSGNSTAVGLKKYCKGLAKEEVPFSMKLGFHSEVYLTPEELVDCFKESIVTDASGNKTTLMMLQAMEVEYASQMNKYTNHIDAIITEAALQDVYPPQLVFNGKGAVFSTMTTAQQDYFFAWPQKKMVALGAENSNLRIPEWSFAEKVGLWLNGDALTWASDIIGDNLAANRVAEWGGMNNGHVILRQMLANYSMGATIFRFNSTVAETELEDDTQWSNGYRQGFLNFLKIVQKGVFPPSPTPSRLAGISPVAIAMPIPDIAHLKKQSVMHNWDTYTPPPTSDSALGQQECWHAYAKVPYDDVTAYVHNTTRRWDNLLPTSPSGFVPVVPFSDKSTVEGNSWCNEAYETNGDVWSTNTVTGAKTTISAELLSQRDNMLFYVDGTCFWQITQQEGDPDTYFVMIMNSEVLAPNGGTVTLKVGNAAGSWKTCDQLNLPGTSIGTLNSTSSVDITIPVGSVRFLRLKKL